MTVHLTTEDLLALADELGVPAVRDLGLLDAAAHRPRASVMGDDAYPDIDTKAAVLLESIVRDDALVDGNKRLAWVAVVVFYALNGHDLHAPEDPAYDLVIDAAVGEIAYAQIASALAQWRSPR